MQVKTILTARVAKEMNSSDEFNQFVLGSIYRHLSGDWGEVSEEDEAANNTEPLYALGAYAIPDGHKIWIKQDYNKLTVLFPDEY